MSVKTSSTKTFRVPAGDIGIIKKSGKLVGVLFTKGTSKGVVGQIIMTSDIESDPKKRYMTTNGEIPVEKLGLLIGINALEFKTEGFSVIVEVPFRSGITVIPV